MNPHPPPPSRFRPRSGKAALAALTNAAHGIGNMSDATIEQYANFHLLHSFGTLPGWLDITLNSNRPRYPPKIAHEHLRQFMVRLNRNLLGARWNLKPRVERAKLAVQLSRTPCDLAVVHFHGLVHFGAYRGADTGPRTAAAFAERFPRGKVMIEPIWNAEGWAVYALSLKQRFDSFNLNDAFFHVRLT